MFYPLPSESLFFYRWNSAIALVRRGECYLDLKQYRFVFRWTTTITNCDSRLLENLIIRLKRKKKKKKTIRIKKNLNSSNLHAFLFDRKKCEKTESIGWLNKTRQRGNIVAIVNCVCEQFHHHEHCITIASLWLL